MRSKREKKREAKERRREAGEKDKGEKEGWWFGVHLTDFYDFLTSD
ncbi:MULTISPECIES: hypothetical protein [Vibrio]|nr:MULTISPECIES: hypothetical protein [Vibrio]